MTKAFRHRVNAGRAIVREQIPFFKKQFGLVPSEWKPDDTRVTFADFAISEGILNSLRKLFPEDDLVSEENISPDEELEMTAHYQWILDPIDGTNNYALGLPFCAISLALCLHGQPAYGWIYDHALDQLVEGGPDHPILINGDRWRPELTDWDPRSCVWALHFPLPAGRSEQLAALMETYRVRCLGSAALQLLYVALGKLEGVLDEKVRIWDVAASLAILQAAGLPHYWIGGNPFPFRKFSLSQPALRFFAGRPELCIQIADAMEIQVQKSSD